ncbi:hypothetical protein TGP89_278760 [Toxoplasma gondii p89]|uniref:F-box domain-containing protein n=1 Tax=Toxoplasma gondii p89 TaxID=943119 RepID=A0A086JIK6_TOXGO|nr:hypothetical protein TGP89_278760 [Toxoplasma gondii p89]
MDTEARPAFISRETEGRQSPLGSDAPLALPPPSPQRLGSLCCGETAAGYHSTAGERRKGAEDISHDEAENVSKKKWKEKDIPEKADGDTKRVELPPESHIFTDSLPRGRQSLGENRRTTSLYSGTLQKTEHAAASKTVPSEAAWCLSPCDPAASSSLFSPFPRSSTAADSAPPSFGALPFASCLFNGNAARWREQRGQSGSCMHRSRGFSSLSDSDEERSPPASPFLVCSLPPSTGNAESPGPATSSTSSRPAQADCRQPFEEFLHLCCKQDARPSRSPSEVVGHLSSIAPSSSPSSASSSSILSSLSPSSPSASSVHPSSLSLSVPLSSRSCRFAPAGGPAALHSSSSSDASSLASSARDSEQPLRGDHSDKRKNRGMREEKETKIARESQDVFWLLLRLVQFLTVKDFLSLSSVSVTFHRLLLSPIVNEWCYFLFLLQDCLPAGLHSLHANVSSIPSSSPPALPSSSSSSSSPSPSSSTVSSCSSSSSSPSFSCLCFSPGDSPASSLLSVDLPPHSLPFVPAFLALSDTSPNPSLPFSCKGRLQQRMRARRSWLIRRPFVHEFFLSHCSSSLQSAEEAAHATLPSQCASSDALSFPEQRRKDIPRLSAQHRPPSVNCSLSLGASEAQLTAIAFSWREASSRISAASRETSWWTSSATFLSGTPYLVATQQESGATLWPAPSSRSCLSVYDLSSPLQSWGVGAGDIGGETPCQAGAWKEPPKPRGLSARSSVCLQATESKRGTVCACRRCWVVDMALGEAGGSETTRLPAKGDSDMVVETEEVDEAEEDGETEVKADTGKSWGEDASRGAKTHRMWALMSCGTAVAVDLHASAVVSRLAPLSLPGVSFSLEESRGCRVLPLSSASGGFTGRDELALVVDATGIFFCDSRLQSYLPFTLFSPAQPGMQTGTHAGGRESGASSWSLEGDRPVAADCTDLMVAALCASQSIRLWDLRWNASPLRELRPPSFSSFHLRHSASSACASSSSPHKTQYFFFSPEEAATSAYRDVLALSVFRRVRIARAWEETAQDTGKEAERQRRTETVLRRHAVTLRRNLILSLHSLHQSDDRELPYNGGIEHPAAIIHQWQWSQSRPWRSFVCPPSDEFCGDTDRLVADDTPASLFHFPPLSSHLFVLPRRSDTLRILRLPDRAAITSPWTGHTSPSWPLNL